MRPFLPPRACVVLLASAALAGQPRLPAPKQEAVPVTGLPLQKIGSAHFDVAFTVTPALGKGYAALCERAYGRFCELLNVPDGEAVWDGKCKVFLFGTPAEFVRFATTVAGPTVALSGGFA